MNKEIPEYTYCEEARKKAMSDWRDRYRATFRSDGMFCNWLKLNGFFNKPVTPKYLKEYEHQKALIAEFELYKGVYDGLGSDHKYYGNKGKYFDIFHQEQEKIYAQAREETRRRYSKVTQGHTPNRPNPPRRKRLYRD